jgi:hypothetical protein
VFLPDERLGPGEESEMRVPFTRGKAEHMARGNFDSTRRELRTVAGAIGAPPVGPACAEFRPPLAAVTLA